MINDAYGSLTFDFIKGGNNAENNIVSDLALPESMENGIKISWKSDHSDVIKETGEVFCPIPGSAPCAVELTAVISRGNYAQPKEKTFHLVVMPYTNSHQLYDKLKNSLTFDCISAEAIDSVTENLSLPNQWYYGSSISWYTDSKYLTVNTENNTGIVIRPEYGTGNAMVILTAQITYQNETINKSFAITVNEKNYLEGKERMWEENCENWSLGTVEFTGTGTWTMPKTDGVNDGTFSAAQDLLNRNNTAVKMTVGTQSNANTSGDLRYTYTSALSGIVTFGMRCLITGNNSRLTLMLRTPNSNAAGITLGYGQITTTSYYSDPDEKKAATFLYHGAAYPIGEWFDIRIEANTELKKFNVYINDEWISADGNVVYLDTFTGAKDYVPYDSSDGIPYTYYANPERISTIQAVNISQWLGGGNSDAPTDIYLDDFYIDKGVRYTQNQLAAAQLYETELAGKNNLNNLTSDLVIPAIDYKGIKISAKSSDEGILSDRGTVKRAEKAQNVEWIVSFNDGDSVYKKVFPITVAAVSSENVTDEEAAALDVADVILTLKENYLLSALESNITIPVTGRRGSKITCSSSDSMVITNAGIIKRADENKSAVLTITAVKNDASAQGTVDVTVAKKLQNQPSGGGSAAAGRGASSSAGAYVGGTSAVSANEPNDNKIGEKSRFTDVSPEHWAYDAIQYLAKADIINGNENSAFEPECGINREEFVKILVSALKLSEVHDDKRFADVAEGAWYEKYIMIAAENHLVNGKTDGTFGVGEKISRQDMAVMIYRAAGLSAVGAKTKFYDEAEIADYAKDAVFTLNSCEIIHGDDNGCFNPGAETSRAEAAALIYRAIKNKLFGENEG